ncbi:hypothetical protein L9F63_018226, partial [Diploptera punctata]
PMCFMNYVRLSIITYNFLLTGPPRGNKYGDLVLWLGVGLSVYYFFFIRYFMSCNSLRMSHGEAICQASSFKIIHSLIIIINSVHLTSILMLICSCSQLFCIFWFNNLVSFVVLFCQIVAYSSRHSLLGVSWKLNSSFQSSAWPPYSLYIIFIVTLSLDIMNYYGWMKDILNMGRFLCKHLNDCPKLTTFFQKIFIYKIHFFCLT